MEKLKESQLIKIEETMNDFKCLSHHVPICHTATATPHFELHPYIYSIIFFLQIIKKKSLFPI